MPRCVTLHRVVGPLRVGSGRKEAQAILAGLKGVKSGGEREKAGPWRPLFDF